METKNPWAAAGVTALPPVSHVPLGTPRKGGERPLLCCPTGLRPDESGMDLLLCMSWPRALGQSGHGDTVPLALSWATAQPPCTDTSFPGKATDQGFFLFCFVFKLLLDFYFFKI